WVVATRRCSNCRPRGSRPPWMRKASCSMSSNATADQTSRRSSRSSHDELPPALSSMWRLCRLGYTHEPRLAIVGGTLTLLQALPDAVVALVLALGGA